MAKRRRLGAQEIARELRGRIEGNELAPGDKLPSIRELSVQYRVAYETARQAVEQLKELGLVVAKHGSAVRVSEPVRLRYMDDSRFARSNWANGIPAFAADRIASGKTWSYTDQTNRVDPVYEADEEIAAALGLEVGDRVVARQRTVRDGDVITHILTSYYRPEDVEGTPIMDDTPGTAGGAGGGYAVLAEKGMAPREGVRFLDVALPTLAEQDALECRATEPIVRLSKVVRDENGRVIEYARGPHVGKFFRWINTFEIAS